MYLLVFCVRYMDLFMYYISMYNTCMKIFFIASTAFVIYLMRYKKPFCTVSIHFIKCMIDNFIGGIHCHNFCHCHPNKRIIHLDI